jgi:hypothetical protein
MPKPAQQALSNHRRRVMSGFIVFMPRNQEKQKTAPVDKRRGRLAN